MFYCMADVLSDDPEHSLGWRTWSVRQPRVHGLVKRVWGAAQVV